MAATRSLFLSPETSSNSQPPEAKPFGMVLGIVTAHIGAVSKRNAQAFLASSLTAWDRVATTSSSGAATAQPPKAETRHAAEAKDTK